ncbi:MAG: dTDP-4-dehydrorhamnose 3,5-epimerase [Rhodospirillaceae bacterium TMED8]|nr:dTDP-4-dehydrorhamnose 3,5-epimerase [Magnetovibrio sp.]OUT51271.1 MAG: dTDP-4-dehydrorhamnose 3,5-epimerase [Rhodospirillaceae bacterium TMED8]|tara:strand:+ start:805 stop:1362 length:558 start_codon:yes stop_codon:yes gene_type:complete
MHVQQTHIPGLVTIEPEVFRDQRGAFVEVFRQDTYKAAGIEDEFLQDNHSRSSINVLRGLHYQIENSQAQLIYVSSGAIFDVVVDLRRDSPTYLKWYSVELTGENFKQIYMPPGFAHGFCVIGTHAEVHYKVTTTYNREDEGGIAWNDPTLNIVWPLDTPKISDRDLKFPHLVNIQINNLPRVSF